MTEFRRVHPLTPMLRGGGYVFAIALLAFNGMTSAALGLFRRLDLQVVGIVVALVAVAFLLSLLWWRVTTYTVTSTEVVFRHGLIAKKVRTARIDRAQAVEVVHPFVARLFGLALVRIETAGGMSSRIDIGYLRVSVATQLREEILYGEATEDPGEVVVPAIPLRRSLPAALCTYSGVTAIASTVIATGLDFSGAAFVPLILATGLQVWKFVDGAYQFTARKVDNTVLISYGLANLQRKTLRINRVHAVRMHQPPLWRLFGWWRVRVSVAGYGEGTTGMTVLPVGSKETATALIELLMGTVVDPRQPEDGLRSPGKAWLVSPVDWSRQRFVLSDTYAMEYRGRVGASCAVAFRRHIQLASVHIGPLDRLLGLSTVRLALVQGPVSVQARNLAMPQAWALLREI